MALRDLLAQYVGSALGSITPLAQNPDYIDPTDTSKVHLVTPDDFLDHYNNNLKEGDAPFATVEAARASGIDIPTNPVYHDLDGNDITSKVLSPKNTRMKQPSTLQRILNPTAASQEEEINLRPFLSDQANTSTLQIGAKNVGISDQARGSNFPNASPLARYAATQTMVPQENAMRAGIGMLSGSPQREVAANNARNEAVVPVSRNIGTEANTAALLGAPAMSAKAGYESDIERIQAAEREQMRDPNLQMINRAQDANTLYGAENVVPQELANARQSALNSGRVLPVTGSADYSDALTRRGVSDQQLKLMPSLLDTMNKLQMYANEKATRPEPLARYTSEVVPGSQPGVGNIVPAQVNPGTMTMNNGLPVVGGYTPPNVGTETGPSGKVYKVQIPVGQGLFSNATNEESNKKQEKSTLKDIQGDERFKGYQTDGQSGIYKDGKKLSTEETIKLLKKPGGAGGEW